MLLLLTFLPCLIYFDTITVSTAKKGKKLSCTDKNLPYEKYPVKFFFSTIYKNNRKIRHLSDNDTFDLSRLHFDKSRRTTVIIHGFMETQHEKWVNILKRQLLEWDDMNVITVDWSAGFSNYVEYVKAAFNTEYAAIRIKDLIRQLAIVSNEIDETSKSFGYLHLIGFSLGAHVAGQTADLLRREEHLHVDRITALDPVKACFDQENLPLRIKKSDATFVDVIHTDSDLAINYAFGLYEPIGHYDFYANGGRLQPGCFSKRQGRIKSRSALNINAIIEHSFAENGFCSHKRSTEYFIESVKQINRNGCKFWSQPWDLKNNTNFKDFLMDENCEKNNSCIEMGINSELYKDKVKSGVFIVTTTKNPPFCRFKVDKGTQTTNSLVTNN